MPLYVYKCLNENCKCEDELFRSIDKRNDDATCPKCSNVMKRIMKFTTNRDWFRPHWNEHLDDDPIFVESKRHYRKLCKEREVEARCLM